LSFSDSFTGGTSSVSDDSSDPARQSHSPSPHPQVERSHEQSAHEHKPHAPAAHGGAVAHKEHRPHHEPAKAAEVIEASAEVDILFRDMPLLPSVHEDLVAAGFERPTPIQAKCIPLALEGKDIIGLAQTGTGKTAAFAIPIIQKLAHRMELGALVLAPTRELAMQITKVFEELGRASGVRTATIVGGIPMDKDYKALHSWPNVLVATPGRLNDHLENSSVTLNEVEILTVDEADRMHDMGFMPQIRRIIARLPAQRQTLMFTATMPADVERIARSNMRNAVRIQVGLQSAPAHRARQQLFEVDEDQKVPLLLELLRKGHGRVLVFSRTKKGVDKLARVVNARGVSVAKIHGDREQAERDAAMNGFREGRYRILIATDIASRGIDVENIEHVINYDFPRCAEDYVHRIGRTARVEATGLATSFVTRADRMYVSDVRKLIGDKLPMPIQAGGAQPHSQDSHESHSHARPHESAKTQASGQHVRDGQPSGHGQDSQGGQGKRRRRRGGRGRGKPQASPAK
jgi:ATP-dependent RNA helicase RhlE